jgi:hypothetical protein
MSDERAMARAHGPVANDDVGSTSAADHELDTTDRNAADLLVVLDLQEQHHRSRGHRDLDGLDRLEGLCHRSSVVSVQRHAVYIDLGIVEVAHQLRPILSTGGCTREQRSARGGALSVEPIAAAATTMRGGP